MKSSLLVQKRALKDDLAWDSVGAHR